MTRSTFLTLALFGGSALATSSIGLVRRQQTQIPECILNCLTEYDAETTCPTTSQEIFNACWCADTTRPAQNLETCIGSCSSSDGAFFERIFNQICASVSPGPSESTPSNPSATESSPSEPSATGEVGQCASSCFTTYLDATPCSQSDLACLCTDTSDAASELVSCVQQCPEADQSAFQQTIMETCSAGPTGTSTPSDEPSSTPSATSSGTSEPTSTEGACAESCFSTYLGETTCAQEDVACMCTDSSQVAQDLLTCVKSCPAADQSAFADMINEACASASATATTDAPTFTEEPSSTITDETSSTEDVTSTTDEPTTLRTSSRFTVTRSTTTETDAPNQTGGVAPGVKGNLIAMAGGLLAAIVAL